LLNFSIKRIFRPFILSLWRRVWSRIEERLAPIEDRLSRIEGRLAPIEDRVAKLEAGWHQHLPAFLNAVSSVGAFGHDLARSRKETVDIWHRLEFVRSELLYEMRYGGTKATTTPHTAHVVDTQKLTAMQRDGNLRINLGCGHVPREGYINVDMRELPNVDVVADAGNLPFDPGSVHEIFSAHMLEHFPQEDLRRCLLPYWFGLLAPGGKLRAIVPDGEAMIAAAGSGNYPFEHFRAVLFGAQDYEGDFHYNMFTPDHLSKLLTDAGFRDVEVPVKGRANDICFEFEITALRPA
jgi:predicted SAM-dependent methyltransferase